MKISSPSPIHFFGMEYTYTGLARLRRRGIHFFEIEHTIQIHVALKNTKYVFESDVKHEQYCIHFLGLDYTNKKQRKASSGRSGASSGYH